MRLAGAHAAPAPRESAGRFTPIGKSEKGAASPQDCQCVFHEPHDLTRYSKWAHCPAALWARAHRAHFSSASANVSPKRSTSASACTLCSPERQVGHLPSSGTPQACTARARPSFSARPFSPFVSSVPFVPFARDRASKPRRGGKNTAGGERSVTPGTSGTSQRVPRELGSPRDPSRLTGSVAA